MKNRSIAFGAVMVSALLSHPSLGFAGKEGCEIPFRWHGHMIVAEASIGGMSGLKLMIDTAATGSVIDKKVVKALALVPLPGVAQIQASGQLTKSHRYRIPMLRIGPVYAAMDCHEADLGALAVDGIIGLDLLRQPGRLVDCKTNEYVKGSSFTIDFKTRRLHFGLHQQLEHSLPVEPWNPEVIVLTVIEGHPVRLAVDTGADTLVLYKGSKMTWLESMATLQCAKFSLLGGMNRGRQALLRNVELENSRWSSLSGILIDQPNQAKDGLLSVTQLRLKILHFDFDGNLMSWRK
jgi:hypothetical protein